jgi:glucokinase
MSTETHYDAASYALGIDIGGTNIKVGLVTASGDLLEHQTTSTPASHDPQEVMAAVVRITGNLLQQRKPLPVGVGVGFAGVVDAQGESVVAAPNFPQWRGIPLRKMLQNALQLSVVVDNDVNAFGLAEFRWGAAHGLKNFIAVAMGTGLGGAIFIDGRLYRGANGGAAELGFSLLCEDGPVVMGSVGALEGFVGRHAFDQLATKYFPTGEFPNPRSVTDMAEKGDERALAIHRKLAHYLAQAAATWINILNPEAIILGGGTVTGANFFLAEFEKNVRGRALKTHTDCLKILPSKLGYYAGLQGAAALWFER